MVAQEKWQEYSEAKELMFLRTNTPSAPWTVIRSDDKKRARIECMRDLLSRLEYPGKNEALVHDINRDIVGDVTDFWPELNQKVSNKKLKNRIHDQENGL